MTSERKEVLDKLSRCLDKVRFHINQTWDVLGGEYAPLGVLLELPEAEHNLYRAVDLCDALQSMDLKENG